jgi:hypothetical protein
MNINEFIEQHNINDAQVARLSEFGDEINDISRTLFNRVCETDETAETAELSIIQSLDVDLVNRIDAIREQSSLILGDEPDVVDGFIDHIKIHLMSIYHNMFCAMMKVFIDSNVPVHPDYDAEEHADIYNDAIEGVIGNEWRKIVNRMGDDLRRICEQIGNNS